MKFHFVEAGRGTDSAEKLTRANPVLTACAVSYIDSENNCARVNGGHGGIKQAGIDSTTSAAWGSKTDALQGFGDLYGERSAHCGSAS